MKIQFNEAQLSRPQQESLIKVLDALQSENENELVVTPVEFPIKLLVMLDDNIGMVLGWDAEKKSYAGLTTPESEPMPTVLISKPESEPEHGTEILSDEPDPIPESQKDTVDLPKPEPEIRIDLDMAGKVIPPELVMSEIGKRVQALAQALVKLSKPLDTDQRCEVWTQFTRTFIKELIG